MRKSFDSSTFHHKSRFNDFKLALHREARNLKFCAAAVWRCIKAKVRRGSTRRRALTSGKSPLTSDTLQQHAEYSAGARFVQHFNIVTCTLQTAKARYIHAQYARVLRVGTFITRISFFFFFWFFRNAGFYFIASHCR